MKRRERGLLKKPVYAPQPRQDTKSAYLIRYLLYAKKMLLRQLGSSPTVEEEEVFVLAYNLCL
ncbi:hypothetical protein [Sphingobacterium spiritivorum]|uniref:hypothetical protein n=1 Tax=Sphingobacterium spiritivorum TaxID=258 RepID=UPI001919B7FD|nr:hypothetical protein [Sphingobacterium spiritivorum]QQT26241.1 hypothetical protein I6J02_21495 [Sphingobacterium spiritivorum]